MFQGLADKFAADNCGAKHVIKALEFLREERAIDGRAGTDLALREFDLRINALKKRLHSEQDEN